MNRRIFLGRSVAAASLIMPGLSAHAVANSGNMVFAKFFCLDEESDVPAAASGAAMPFGSAFMLPGNYSLGGQSWDCNRTGLYRFMVKGEQFIRNRIVIGSPLDPYELISAISWNHVHGVADETTNMQALSNVGRYHRWRLRCGYIVDLAVWLLPQVGITGRRVNPYTLETQNGFDDGHVVLETLHGSEWRMWDFTNSCYWRNAQGKHLSTAEFIAHIANDGPMPTKHLLDGDIPANANGVPVTGGKLDLGLYMEHHIRRNEEAWFRRIFQAV